MRESSEKPDAKRVLRSEQGSWLNCTPNSGPLSSPAVVGAGGWWIWNEGQKAAERKAAGTGQGEHIVGGDFEGGGDPPWTPPEGGSLRVALKRGGGALEAHHEGKPGDAKRNVAAILAVSPGL